MSPELRFGDLVRLPVHWETHTEIVEALPVGALFVAEVYGVWQVLHWRGARVAEFPSRVAALACATALDDLADFGLDADMFRQSAIGQRLAIRDAILRHGGARFAWTDAGDTDADLRMHALVARATRPRACELPERTP